MRNFRNLSKRKKFNKVELQNKLINTIKYNRLLKKNTFFFSKKIQSKTQIVNNCIVTGRSRSVYRKLKLSRISLKKAVNNYKILGIKKASW